MSKVAGLDRLLGDIENENESGRHWWAIHVLGRSDEIDASAVKLGARVVVYALPCRLVDRGIIVSLSDVVEAAEVANPLRSVVNEAHEWIDVGTTISAAHDWLLVETSSGHFLTRGQRAEGLNTDG